MAKKKVKTNFGEIDKLHKEELRKEAAKNLHDFFHPFPMNEAEWITQIRDYCKTNSVYPPHILQFYKEHHTEKAPD